MFSRLLKLSSQQSFLLFGARGTGKSTLLGECFPLEDTLWIDLLDPTMEDNFSRHPENLRALVLGASDKIQHVVIDEIQKIPKLLDVVQQLMGMTQKQFILTGSSARKLRYGAGNLLAGRAFVYYLFPLSFLELENVFELELALKYGLLPRLFHLDTEEDKQSFLTAYAHTYLKEEVWAEQLIKKLDPFRRFLEVAAQMNGRILNYHKISQDVGADDKTVANYFSILEDTLLGFFLEPFRSSFRKRLSQKPKFYFVDVGIVRALSRTLSLPISPKTSYYGELFEQFIVAEIFKLLSYFQPEAKLSFLQTKDDFEIDLVLERPGKPLCLIEIKSTDHVNASMLTLLNKTAVELQAEAFCLSNDKVPKQFENVQALPWDMGIKKLVGIN